MILSINGRELMEYNFRFEIDDEIWELISECRVPEEVLNELLTSNEEFLPQQFALAAMGTIVGLTVDTPHSGLGCDDRYLNLEHYECVTDSAAVRVPGQRQWAADYFGEDDDEADE